MAQFDAAGPRRRSQMRPSPATGILADDSSRGTMRHHLVYAGEAGLIAAQRLMPGIAAAQAASPEAMAEYRRKLAAWHAAYDPFEAIAGPYWTSIAEKRKLRFAKRRNGQAIVL